MGYTVNNIDEFILCRCPYVLSICLQSAVARDQLSHLLFYGHVITHPCPNVSDGIVRRRWDKCIYVGLHPTQHNGCN